MLFYVLYWIPLEKLCHTPWWVDFNQFEQNVEWMKLKLTVYETRRKGMKTIKNNTFPIIIHSSQIPAVFTPAFYTPFMTRKIHFRFWSGWLYDRQAWAKSINFTCQNTSQQQGLWSGLDENLLES